MRKIYIFLPTGNLGASSRYRILQYKNILEKNFVLEINEFLDNKTYMYWKNNKFIKVIPRLPYRILKTIRFAIKIEKNSTIVIHRDIIPFGNMWIEKYLKYKNCKIIVDIDDAIYLENTSEISNKKNKLMYNLKYGKRYDILFKISDKIICGNKYLEDYVKNFCNDTKIIPTVVNTSEISTKSSDKINDNLDIAWIGNPGNTGYILEVMPIINKIAKEMKQKIRLNLIGSKEFSTEMYQYLDITFNTWSLEKEYDLLKKSDIGIMPLKDTSWAKGKCALKLLQYMAVGIPVIGSAVGENKSVIINGKNGFLCNDEKEWEKSIIYFIENREKLNEMGNYGREFVEENYSINRWSNELINYIK